MSQPAGAAAAGAKNAACIRNKCNSPYEMVCSQAVQQLLLLPLTEPAMLKRASAACARTPFAPPPALEGAALLCARGSDSGATPAAGPKMRSAEARPSLLAAGTAGGILMPVRPGLVRMSAWAGCMGLCCQDLSRSAGLQNRRQAYVRIRHGRHCRAHAARHAFKCRSG
jgi:hypothetical protein